MESQDPNVRWQKIASVRDELDEPAVVVPICVSRLDGRRLLDLVADCGQIVPASVAFRACHRLSSKWTVS